MTSLTKLDPTENEAGYRAAVAERQLTTERGIVRRLRATAREQASKPPVILRPTAPTGRDRSGIVASARRLTGDEAKNKKAAGSASKTAAWQEEAWELHDLIGEQRFLGNTLAGRMSQAAFYVGRLDPTASPGTRPEPVEDATIQRVLDAIGDGPAGFAQIIHRAGVNLFVAGEGWLVGIPPRLIPGTPEHKAATDLTGQLRLVDRAAADQKIEDDILTMRWRMLSVAEIDTDQSGTAKIQLEDGVTVEAPASQLYLVRLWRPHPRYAWEADSPTRASLPVLRELLGLTMSISAQIDSRLAGAGILLISDQASAALKQAAGIDPSSSDDPFVDTLIDTMVTPIKDRSAASAVVPLVVTVPADVVDRVKHITFSTPLDKESQKLRDEAIRRLALGQDAPPELLLGVGGMNHWGAWLVREDVVKTHLEPPLALICDALTTEYLRPILIAMGKTPEEAEEHVVWYDVDNLISRPNRGEDAKELYDRGAITDKALREANGFEEGDAPEETAEIQNDPAVDRALQLVANAPSLMQNPGLPAIVEQIRAVLEGQDATAAAAAAATAAQNAPAVEVVEGESSTEGGPPNTADDPAPIMEGAPA